MSSKDKELLKGPMKSLKVNWRMVLVRPRNPLNIGAAARAWANFGWREMLVVAPFEPTWEEARSSAVGAGQVMKSARAVPHILEAIGDMTLVLGTTTGARRHLERGLLALPDLAAWLRRRKFQGRAALLFGSEKTGLSNEDLSRCHALVRIPTSPGCPSMNLGQAVAVCAYELAKAGGVGTLASAAGLPRAAPAPLHSLEHLFERAAHLLDLAGYLQPRGRAASLIKLRRLLLDLRLSTRDVRALGGVLAQMEWKLENVSPSEL
jgi:TrmH family RNA methyltransferase